MWCWCAKTPFYFLGIVLFGSLSVHAQVAAKDYLEFSLGYTYQKVKDASLSPLTYGGHLGHIGLAYRSLSDRWRNEVQLQGFGAKQYPLQGSPDNFSETLTFAGRLHYRLSYKLSQAPGGTTIYGGIASNNLWDYRSHNRFGNSSENFTGIAAIGPSAQIQKTFHFWQQHWQLEYVLDLPLAAFVIRPGFIKPLLNDEPSTQEWAFWGDYFGLFSTTRWAWLLPNGNQIALSYQWEYAAYQPLNSVQLAGHHLALSTLFKF